MQNSKTNYCKLVKSVIVSYLLKRHLCQSILYLKMLLQADTFVHATAKSKLTAIAEQIKALQEQAKNVSRHEIGYIKQEGKFRHYEIWIHEHYKCNAPIPIDHIAASLLYIYIFHV